MGTSECGESHQANMDWVDRALTGPTFLVLSDCYDICCSTWLGSRLAEVSCSMPPS